MTCVRRKSTPEEKRSLKKMRRQKKSQLKRVIKEDLSKEVKKAKQDAKFNWKLASTYWDRWRLEVEEQHEFQTQRQPQGTKIRRIMLELPPSILVICLLTKKHI